MNLTYKLSIPTDNGFWGRECKKCEKYFKIYLDHIKDKMFCPYCGEMQENESMWTKDQNNAVDEITNQLTDSIIDNELDKMLTNLSSESKFFIYKPEMNTQISNPITHVEKAVDTEIECPTCETRFQVYGIFGFCPVCKEDNILIYEAHLQIILHEIDNSSNPNRSLRHSYNDLVSTFELYCENISKKHGLGTVKFQNLFSVKKLFKKYGLDIYEGIDHAEKIVVKRIFEKRHAYIHGPGKITESYIKNVPEDSSLLGQIAELSKDEFILGVSIIKKVIKNIREKYSN